MADFEELRRLAAAASAPHMARIDRDRLALQLGYAAHRIVEVLAEIDRLRARVAELGHTLEGVRAPLSDRYACQRCGRRDGLDAVLPDFAWEPISAAAGGLNILCLWCMDELAGEVGLPDMAAALHFSGHHLHGSSDVRFAESQYIAVRSAVAAERAECAKIVEGLVDNVAQRDEAARRIRARGEG